MEMILLYRVVESALYLQFVSSQSKQTSSLAAKRKTNTQGRWNAGNPEIPDL
jgi:hypothetical protein